MGPLDDGSALLVWRDNDTPLESAAGPVMRTVVHAASIEQPSMLVASESAGAPSLLPGWATVTDAADMTRLAPVGRAGEVVGIVEQRARHRLGENPSPSVPRACSWRDPPVAP